MKGRAPLTLNGNYTTETAFAFRSAFIRTSSEMTEITTQDKNIGIYPQLLIKKP